MQISDYRAKLTEVETAISACVTTGQKYAVVGSHSNERVSLPELRKLEQYYRSKILRLSGYRTSRTRPDFSL